MLKIPYTSSLLFQDVISTNLLDGLTIKLFQNDYTPVNTSVAGDFTVATFDGYSNQTLSGFSAAALNVDNKAQTVGDLVTWTKTAGATSNTIYGYYVVTGGGALVYAERNPAGGVLVNTTGQTFSVLPRFTYKGEL